MAINGVLAAAVVVAVLAVFVTVESKATLRGLNDDAMTSGSIAYRDQFPWHVAVLKVGAGHGGDFEAADMLGGGVVISRSYVLTAASALRDTLHDQDQVVVQLGARSLDDKDNVSIRVASKQLIRHPQWNRTTAENDIALIHLKAPQIVADKTKVRLPLRAQSEASYTGVTLSIASWGTHDEQNERSLPSVYNQEVLSQGDCQTQANLTEAVPFTKLCIYEPTDPNTPGWRDAGDAAVYLESDNVYTLAGIVSGQTQGFGDKPTILARVGQYLDWIQDNSDVKID